MNKNELRQKFKKVRANIPESDRKNASEKICAALLSLGEYKNAKTVMCYSPIGSEADVMPFMRRVIADKKTLLLPRVTGEGEMEAAEAEELSSLREGKYKISEPSGKAFSGEIDFAVIPAVAADADGYRIGYGKGYYDRFLSKRKVKFSAVAVFSLQITGQRFSEPHDKAADCVICENGVLK